jgi:hypothetical protein
MDKTPSRADYYGTPEQRIGWYLPDQLRWLDDNRDAAYMPCGQLVGVTLRQCADLLESQAEQRRQAAQGTEARRAETGTGSVYDGPVAESDAPNDGSLLALANEGAGL